MTYSTHAYIDDERNDHVLVDVNGELFPRREAKISIFDSGFVLGDGVWEGLRAHPGPGGKGVIAFLDRHLARLWDGAKTLDFEMGLTKQALTQTLYKSRISEEAARGR